MKFNTYLPCELLRPYVKIIAIAETTEEKTYTVLPDTGLVICIQYKIKSLDVGTTQFLLNCSGLNGIQDSYRVCKNPPGTGAVLICFKAAGAAAFFKQPMHDFFGESVLFENLMPRCELLKVEEQLCNAQADLQKIRVVEQFLFSRFNQGSRDNLVSNALQLIYHSKGNIRVKDLTGQLHASQSSLEKRFRRAVGASPKKFTSIVRFRYAIQHYNPQNPLSDLAYEAGFYDQSHFIKEFKCFTGETPEMFFNKK